MWLDVKRLGFKPPVPKRVFERFDLASDARLAVGIKRFDYTKGILNRMRSIDLLLSTRPEWKGKFTFVQVAAPTRSKLASYSYATGRGPGRIEFRCPEMHCLGMAENQTPFSPGDFAGAEVDRSNAARSDERENDRARGAVDEGGLGRDLGRIQGNTRDRGVRDLERHGEACATIVVISPRAEPGRARRHIQGNPLGLGAVFAPCLETYVSPAHDAVQFFCSCWRCSKKCCD